MMRGGRSLREQHRGFFRLAHVLSESLPPDLIRIKGSEDVLERAALADRWGETRCSQI
jgi:hypothetical protein